MPSTDLLKQFGLNHNPFIDRTAEKTQLRDDILYAHSDLRGFQPSETTYVFFGKRGSGKTTIRLQMQQVYNEFNEQLEGQDGSRGHYIVDIARPGHVTSCLRQFQKTLQIPADSWDASFDELWQCTDLVDVIVSYVMSDLVQQIAKQTASSKAMLDALRSNAYARKQFLLLAHLYSHSDLNTLWYLQRCFGVSMITSRELVGTAVLAATSGAVYSSAKFVPNSSTDSIPSFSFDSGFMDKLGDAVKNHRRGLAVAAAATAGLTGLWWYYTASYRASLARARKLQSTIRVVPHVQCAMLAALLDSVIGTQESWESVHRLYLGVGPYQKLGKINELLKLLGYQSLTVFGDCFDEVGLLDPVQYPSAIRAFAREICRNDILNFGRMHYFLPDSRLALNLNTDKTLKEARFDRHFVRDLTWSRHQLEELAMRRFQAAQRKDLPDTDIVTFEQIFQQVCAEDFSSYISKISTPRELLIMMTEMFARIESHPDGKLTAQDMELAVTRALEQSV